MSLATTLTSKIDHEKADRIGVFASVLCAIHCAITPVLLLFLPTFGSIWAHPLSHILVAIFVVPLAAFSVHKGYKKHGKKWILASAWLGIFFVIAGAIVPAFEPTPETATQVEMVTPTPEPVATPAVTATAEESSSCSTCASCAPEAAAPVISEKTPDQPATTTGCVDNCCPSLITTESGETKLHIPLAAIITTLGGVFLIAAHFGNLCFTRKECQTSCCNHCTT